MKAIILFLLCLVFVPTAPAGINNPPGITAVTGLQAALNAKQATINYVCIVDQKSSGTEGGTFTAGAWRTRDLNTKRSDTSNLASVAGNQITLAAGTYSVHVFAPAFGGNRNSARLRDITNTATLLVGTGTPAYAGVVIKGKITLAGSTVLEVQHYAELTTTTNGYGAYGQGGEVETYTIVEFIKL